MKAAAWLLAGLMPLQGLAQATVTTMTPVVPAALPEPGNGPVAAVQSGKAKDTTTVTGQPVQADALRSQRMSVKLYLEGVKLLEKQQPEAAWKRLRLAASLEPSNATYQSAAELARESAVTQLVQQANRERPKNAAEADRLLRHALEIDPKNEIALQHAYELDGGAAASTAPVIQRAEETEPDAARLNAMAAAGSGVGRAAVELQDPDTPLAEGGIVLEPAKDKHSFHLHANAQQVVKDVFRAYGVDASVHESVQGKTVRLDVDDVTFNDATRVLGMVTKTFYEPLDPHRVIVAQDTREFRTQFQRLELETVYLPGLTDKDLTDVTNVAKNVFEAQQASTAPTRNTLTIRAPSKTLTAFNRTLSGLETGKNQVQLEVKVIQLSHISARETGTTFLQQTGVYNAYSEINTIIQQNQSAVQEILTSGLVPNASTVTNELEIIAILVASGQLTGTLFNNGFALFGNGLTTSLLAPSPATLTLSLNSSDTRALDDIRLRLQDDEAGTFKIGQKYPIETSSYSAATLPSISGLSSLASSLSSQTVPQIQYEDLGLTLKATPKVLRSDDVALTIDLKIESLGGSSLNNIPILDSQQFAGVLTLKAGETAVLLSDISRQESRALSGLPGISDIPGLQDISDISRSQNVARLLILVTPYVVRETQQPGHSPRMVLDKPANSR